MLYTGKGDDGTTKTFNLRGRHSKGNLLSEALGSLDELNSFLGLCKAHVHKNDLNLSEVDQKLSQALEEIQQNLFIIQAEVAGDDKKIIKEKILNVEKIINAIEKEIPKITGFSIAGGTELSALLDVARAQSRRTERCVVRLRDSGERAIKKGTCAYLNRLSSLLFAFARFVNHKSGTKEKQPHYK